MNACTHPVSDTTPFDLFTNWDQAITSDTEYTSVLQAVQKNKRKFPLELSLKLSITECGIQENRLTFRDRL